MGENSPILEATPAGAVFLSYASEDGAAAERIAAALRSAGIEVWFDQSELRGGDAWDRQIRQQIHDCRLFIAIISAHSEARDEGYFRREWKLAVDRTHDMAEKKAFLVPVVIDGTSERGSSVPEKFRELQWTRLPGGETPPAFVERVRRLVVADPSAAPTAAVRQRGPGVTLDSAKPTRAPRGYKPALWATSVVVTLIAVAYLAADKFWVSKHPASVARTTGVGGPRLAVPEKSIAVLPFIDMSEKHDQEYFADGMAEEMLDLLATIPGLKVIGRTSSFQFKGKNQDLRTVGSALGVKYVVEGSVRKSDKKVRLTAQLLRAEDGSQVWSDTYDVPLGDVLAIQDQVAKGLVSSLQLSVDADFALRRLFKNAQAHDLYLRGVHAFDRFDKEGFESAAAYFEESVALEPDSVAAAEGLAWTHELYAEFDYVEPREGFERARQSIERVLRLDPRSSNGHAALSTIHLNYDWDWAAAEREAKEALRLEPQNSVAMAMLARVYAVLGQWDDSARLFESAIALDPLSASWHFLFSGVLFPLGRLEAAEAEARKALEINPTYPWVHTWLGALFLREGKLDAALTEMQQQHPVDSGGLALVYHAMGLRVDCDTALTAHIKQHAQDDAMRIASVYAYRGERDEAFRWLDRAYRQKDPGLPGIKGYMFLKSLAGDARYEALLRKMNLPE